MQVSLYRKYRPNKFSEIAGQGAAVELLRSSFLASRLSQAYLFSGPRGCGKTTAARILAKLVNCENPADGEPCCECASCRAIAAGEHLDVMEIDAASNNGVDNIRELNSHVGLVSMSSRSKVYILDEVHMLSAGAFNALLKTIEEPPQGVLFIFATTEPHKVPVTIRSRCQHIPFHKIQPDDIAARLRQVAGFEGFEADGDAIWEIARSADGALRDALSLAEQAVALGGGALSSESVRSLFGGGSRREAEQFVSLLRANTAGASAELKKLLSLGVSQERFLDALFPLLRDMWAYSLWADASFGGMPLSEGEKDFLKKETPSWSGAALRGMVGSCAALYPRARWGASTDVFAGLLLFSLMEASNGTAKTTIQETAPFGRGDRPRSPALDQSPVSGGELPAPTLPDRPLPPAPDIDSASAQSIAAKFRELWESDISICAIMTDASIYINDGVITIDSSNSTKHSAAALESPRTRVAIERTFGATKPSPAVTKNLPPAPAAMPVTDGEPSRGKPANPSGVSIEMLSLQLGAEILMSKPINADIPEADEPDTEE
ncbi:hypothetical protein FACS1894167_02530 [Synergistales bacterium]|nr:hypothetical protein FACS1894167_02530 [Synergistales bacterium]